MSLFRAADKSRDPRRRRKSFPGRPQRAFFGPRERHFVSSHAPRSRRSPTDSRWGALAVWAAISGGRRKRTFWQTEGFLTRTAGEGYGGRLTPEPDVRRGCAAARTPRAHRRWCSCVRSGPRDDLDDLCSRVLGEPDPIPGHAPGQPGGRRYAVRSANLRGLGPSSSRRPSGSRKDVPGRGCGGRLRREITTEIVGRAGPSHYAETTQQDLAKKTGWVLRQSAVRRELSDRF